ncbi:MAG: HAMP domain-containing protein [Candidatus Hydrogenedentes bacterium]|nr:HAMP domain-containing protein [Candidatus Hydrogenedentota bacterium]
MKRKNSPKTSLALRLSCLHALVLGACSLFSFLAVYTAMVSNVHHRVDERLRHEHSEVASLFSLNAISGIQETLTRLAHAEGTDQVFYRLLDERGVLLAESDAGAWTGLEVEQPALSAAVAGQPFYDGAVVGNSREQARVLYARLSERMILQVALRTAREMQPIRDLRQLFFTFGVLGLVFALIVGWFIVKRALFPLKNMTSTALMIAEGNLEARVEPASRDRELDHLAQAFNLMLDRIQLFVRELREMNDSLAHDLRTVLARINLGAGRLLASRPISEEQESLTVAMVQDSAELLGMLNTVMDLSEINTRIVQPQFAPVDISELSAELFEFFEATAREKQITMQLHGADQAVVLGDRSRLRRALANLLDNAIKYTPEGGRVTVEVRHDKERVTFSVTDSGIGIPAEAQPFIFDRFYRADKSRSSDGHGLGLSLAAAIIQLHGGAIHVQSKEGSGSVFSVSLPQSTPASS